MLRSFFKVFLCAAAIAAQLVLAQHFLAQGPARESRVEGQPGHGVIDQETLLLRLAARDRDLVILDVRTPEEYAAGHIAGAINIAYDQLPARADELESAKHKDIVLYCRSGRRTAIAIETLREEGFTRLLHLDGDMLAWRAARRPLSVANSSSLARAPDDEEPRL